jgi:hypothetical protein
LHATFYTRTIISPDEEKEIFNNLVNDTDLKENDMLEFLFSYKYKVSSNFPLLI